MRLCKILLFVYFFRNAGTGNNIFSKASLLKKSKTGGGGGDFKQPSLNKFSSSRKYSGSKNDLEKDAQTPTSSAFQKNSKFSNFSQKLMESESTSSQKFIKRKNSGNPTPKSMFSGGNTPVDGGIVRKRVDSKDFISAGEISKLTFKLRKKDEEILKLKKKIAQGDYINQLYQMGNQEKKSKNERISKLLKENSGLSEKVFSLETENVKNS